MTSNEHDGDVKKNYIRTASDHQEHSHSQQPHDDPARDFVPPRSYVRKRQLPTSTGSYNIPPFRSPYQTNDDSSREVDEGWAAYKAVSDQLSRSSRGGRDRRLIKSSASSTSSMGMGIGTLNDIFNSDLIRGPVGSFAEDSPIRDRDSPNTSYQAKYSVDLSPPSDGSYHQEDRLRDPSKDLFSKWSSHLPDSSAAFGYPPPDCLKVSPTKASPSSKTVTTSWNALFQDIGVNNLSSPVDINRKTIISPSKTTAAISKKLSMQDVFRSPPAHDFKKRHQLLTSPSFSFGGIDTPGGQSNGFSPVDDYATDDEYVDATPRKLSKFRFESSFDDDNLNPDNEQFDFVPPFPAKIPGTSDNELEGVRRSPLQSSDRKSSSAKKPPAVVPRSVDSEFRTVGSRKPTSSASKSVKKKTPKKSDANPRALWTDASAKDTGNIRRMTMGEPQSSQSLADINIMMRRDQSHIIESTIKAPPAPKLPVPKKSTAIVHDASTKQTKTPSRNGNVHHQEVKLSGTKSSTKQQKQVRSKGSDTSSRIEVTKPSEASNSNHYAWHSSAIPFPYSTYPPSSVPPYHHHTRPPGGRPVHIPPSAHYPPPSRPAGTSVHYPQSSSRLPHMPQSYLERRTSSPALPSGYMLQPVTPRFQGGYAVPTQSGTTGLYSSTHPNVSVPPQPPQPLPYGWSIPSIAAPPRYTSPSIHNSSLALPPSSSRTMSVRTLSHSSGVGKENSSNKSGALTTAKTKPRNPCNCKKSRCLKLYCECFSTQIFCEGCNCADCYNTEQYHDIRDKAVKEVLHKNKTAFDVKATVTIGCKCRRSECLKKYCECFQAGIVCIDQCKCISCANRAGSQKLIDKRRKMKDSKGAEYAMRLSKEVWERQLRLAAPVPHKPPLITATKTVVQHRTASLASTSRLHARPEQLGPPTTGRVGFSPMDKSVGESSVDTVPSPTEGKADDQSVTTPAVPPFVISSTTTTTNIATAELIPTNATVAVTESVKSKKISATSSSTPGVIETAFPPVTPAGVRRLSFDSTTNFSVNKKQKKESDTDEVKVSK